MDRKEFLKTTCGFGVCGCALGVLGLPGAVTAGAADAPDQRLAFARFQVAKMVGFMAGGPNTQAFVGVLEKTGRECAKLGGMPPEFKGNPEAYFAAAHKNWGTDFSWDKENGLVTVAVAEGECGCPLVDSRRTPAFWCNCSVGYQKEAFETVFGRPVEVTLKKSKLDGNKRCVFEVKLSQPDTAISKGI